MAAFRPTHRSSSRELTELSAMLRAIAMDRKDAAPALREMVAAYELRAIAARMAEKSA
jgi:hypothetical protein